ncbi:hypothetical protein ACOSP7_021019 [Xanthoceras sorbifolium]
MATLWADVYMYACSTLPEPTETFKAEVRIPWTGEYRVRADDKDLQQVFAIFKSKNIDTIRLDMDLLPFAWSPPDEYVGEVSALTDSEKVFQPTRNSSKACHI